MAEAPPEFPRWLISTARAMGYTTNTALAKALGVSQPNVSRWRNGSRPSVEHLVKVSDLFGVELKALLVLSGYIEAEVGGRESSVLRSVSEVERVISERGLDGRDAFILRDYWQGRMNEETGRLEELADLAEEIKANGVNETTLARHVPELTQTHLSFQVTDAAFNLVASVRKLSLEDEHDADLDPSYGLMRPKSQIGKPLGAIHGTGCSQLSDGSWRLELMGENGIVKAWGMPVATSEEATRTVVDWLNRAGAAWEERSEDASEEEGPGER